MRARKQKPPVHLPASLCLTWCIEPRGEGSPAPTGTLSYPPPAPQSGYFAALSKSQVTWVLHALMWSHPAAGMPAPLPLPSA
jgi:hypothetical protein